MNCNKFKMKTKIYERGKKEKKCVLPILNHLRAASTRLEATLMALTPIAWEYANHKGEGGRNKRERVFTRLRIIAFYSAEVCTYTRLDKIHFRKRGIPL